MGRPVYYRQRIRSQAASVQAKSLLTHLAFEVRARREISPEEAWLVALDAYSFLENGLLDLAPGQIELPCIAGHNSHFRQARWSQTEKVARLSVLAEEDAILLEEFGTRVMQQGRLARIIEEAYQQEALLDGQRLCLLMPLTLTAIRQRLNVFWEQSVLLPLAGMTRQSREQLKVYRALLAVERYLKGDDPRLLRRELAIDPSRWAYWWRGFQEAAARPEASPLSLARQNNPELLAGWQELGQKYKDHPRGKERLGKPVATTALPAVDPEERLWQQLTAEHGYSIAAARQFMQELRDLAVRLKQLDRRTGQLITFGVAADEPPGRSLNEARLLLVVLDYVTAEDWGMINRTSPQELKWKRLERLCTQSYEQGVALSQPDLAYLLGISSDCSTKYHQKARPGDPAHPGTGGRYGLHPKPCGEDYLPLHGWVHGN